MLSFPHARKKRKTIERDKIARLEQAEADLSSLKIRASNAIRTLDNRQRRNHWRESIEKMIQGAH